MLNQNLEFNVSVSVFCAPVADPLGLIAFAIPDSFLIPNPGLLSIIWSPGNINIVVLSTKSLSFPRRYENLKCSIRLSESS